MKIKVNHKIRASGLPLPVAFTKWMQVKKSVGCYILFLTLLRRCCYAKGQHLINRFELIKSISYPLFLGQFHDFLLVSYFGGSKMRGTGLNCCPRSFGWFRTTWSPKNENIVLQPLPKPESTTGKLYD